MIELFGRHRALTKPQALISYKASNFKESSSNEETVQPMDLERVPSSILSVTRIIDFHQSFVFIFLGYEIQKKRIDLNELWGYQPWYDLWRPSVGATTVPGRISWITPSPRVPSNTSVML